MISPSTVGILAFVFMLVLMALGMPIAFTFPAVAIPAILYLQGANALWGVLGTVPFTYGSNYVLVAAPLFALMGYFAFHSEISTVLFASAQKWLGRAPGGVAMATMAACTGFAACTGSSIACAVAMGTIALPEMKRCAYDMRLATGAVAVGGTLGILIPPSTVFVIYGVLTEESIGKLFIAGVFPGLILSSLYLVTIYLLAKFRPALAPRGPSFTWGEKFSSLKGVWKMGALFILVMGGIWGGIFTPTEAGAIGAFGALVLAFASRHFSRKKFFDSLSETIKMAGMIWAIIIGAMIFNYVLAISNLPRFLAETVAGLAVSPYIIIVIILVAYIILGMFMDTLAMLVLTVPIFYTIVTHLGFSGIWFGVLVVVMAELGMITPPVGLNVYVIAGIQRYVPLAGVFTGIMFFVPAMLIGTALFVAFPQISLWLPATMMK